MTEEQKEMMTEEQKEMRDRLDRLVVGMLQAMSPTDIIQMLVMQTANEHHVVRMAYKYAMAVDEAVMSLSNLET